MLFAQEMRLKCGAFTCLSLFQIILSSEPNFVFFFEVCILFLRRTLKLDQLQNPQNPRCSPGIVQPLAWSRGSARISYLNTESTPYSAIFHHLRLSPELYSGTTSQHRTYAKRWVHSTHFWMPMSLKCVQETKFKCRGVLTLTKQESACLSGQAKIPATPFTFI